MSQSGRRQLRLHSADCQQQQCESSSKHFHAMSPF